MKFSPTRHSRYQLLFPLGLCTWFMAFIATFASAQMTGTCSITGQVLNETTRTPLVGAAVALESDPRIRGFTEADGSFRLELVPAGDQGVVVEYTGLDTGRARTAVTAGGAANLVVRLNSGIYRMEAFEISTVREGQAAAISSQRA